MIKKIAQPPYWSKVKQGIQTLGLNPEIMSMLNSNKCVWDTAPSTSNPNAVAYVSSEDVNDDGKIDKIHFVINKFPPTATDEEIKGLVSQIAKTLVHEYGHIQDFDAERGMFPGGEGVAEAAERAAEGMINQRLESFSKINTTNKKIGIDNVIKRNSIGEYKMQKELIKLANHLDNIGHRDLADKLDSVIRKSAQDLPSAGDTAADVAKIMGAGGFDPNDKPYDQILDWLAKLGRPVSLRDVDLNKPMGRFMVSAWNTAELWDQAEQRNLLAPGFRENLKNTAAKYYGSEKKPAETPGVSHETGQTNPADDQVDDSVEDSVEDSAEDLILEATSVQSRIDKLAELMSREFTTSIPGTFSR
jgi:hypothetical protein